MIKIYGVFQNHYGSIKLVRYFLKESSAFRFMKECEELVGEESVLEYYIDIMEVDPN